tara:strand:+ start:809 stop:1015 length:207 start_codon:yes stop_codon:yes gene_type:complete
MKKHVHTPQGLKEEDYTDEDNAQYLKDKENYDKLVAELKAYEDLKKSAKAKLISGQPLTEAEANTIVL